MSEGLGPSAAATERSIRRMVVVIVPLWLLAILANLLTGPGHAPGPGLHAATVIACLAAVLAGYTAFVVAGRGDLLVAVLIITAVAIGISGRPVGSLSVFPLVVPWLIMATTVSAALVPGRLGAVTVVAISVGGGAAVAVGDPVDLLGLSGVVAQALVGGACMWSGMQTLRQASSQRDRIAGELLAVESRAAADRARTAEQRRLARGLHDTVINTLGAIRALPLRDRQLLTARCADDLAALDRGFSVMRAEGARPGGQPVGGSSGLPPQVLVSGLVRRATALGLDLQTAGTTSGPDLPAGTAEALDGALREALLNAAKHSGSTRVSLRWYWDGQRGSAELSDAGRGLGGRQLTGGAAQSILARCTEAGIAVRAFDRGGAVISLAWQTSEQQKGPPLGAPTAPTEVLGLAAARVGLSLAVFGGYSTAAIPSGSGRLGSGVAVIITLAATWWAARVHRDGTPDRLPTWCYPLAVALATVLPGVGMSGCARIGWYWWGPLAGLAVLIVVTLVDGRLLAVGAAVAGYLGAFALVLLGTADLTPACSAETFSIILLDLGIVAAVLALRRALLEASRGAEQLWAQVALASRELAEEQARDQVRDRDLQLARAACRPLLAGIAAGDVDPTDPEVRHAAGQAESALRAIQSLPPELGELSTAIAHAVLEAFARGARLGVLVQNASPPPPTSSDAAGRFIEQWVATVGSDQSAQVTVIGLGAETVLMLAGPSSPGVAPAAPPGWRRSDEQGELLYEFGWAN